MNKGQIRIAEELLLDWLRYKGGRICGAVWNYERQTLTLLIEHSDMPEVADKEPYPIITPVYQREEVLGYRYERIRPNA